MSIRTTAIIVTLWSILAGCQAQCARTSKGQDLERISFLLNWTFYGEHAPFFVSQANGYFAQEGLEVDILEGSGSGSTVKVIGSGAHHFGYAGAGTMLKGASVGVPVTAISVLQQINPMAVIFKSDAPIKTAKDLRGKRIGITVGDANSQLLPAFLNVNDIKLDEVDLIKLPTPKAKEDYLLADKVDAFVGFYHDQPPRMQHYSGVKLEWIPYFSAGVSTLSSAIIVHRQYLRERPDLARRFIRAINRGVIYTRDHPKDAAKIFAEAVKGVPLAVAEEMVLLSLPLQATDRSRDKPVGWSHPLDWQDTVGYLTQFSGLRASGHPEAFYTNDFIAEDGE